MNRATEEKKSLKGDLGERETGKNMRTGNIITLGTIGVVVGIGATVLYLQDIYNRKPEAPQVVEQSQRQTVYPGSDTGLVRTITPKISKEDTTGGFVRLPSKDYGKLRADSKRAEELQREKVQLTERLSTESSKADTLKEKLTRLYDQAPVQMREFSYEFSRNEGNYVWQRKPLPDGLSLDQKLLVVQRNYAEKAELGRTIPGFDDKKDLFDYVSLVFAPTSNPRTMGVSSQDTNGKEKYNEYFVGVQEK